jgi:hypothetical protein
MDSVSYKISTGGKLSQSWTGYFKNARWQNERLPRRKEANVTKRPSNPIICMTCDVEIRQKVELSQLEQILQVYKEFGMRGTFFFLLSSKNYGFFENSDVLSNFDEQEFGLHIHWGYTHCGEVDEQETRLRRGLGFLTTDILRKEIDISMNYCKKLGFKPESFRGGGLSQTTSAIKLISKCGFKVDSSVAAKLNQSKKWFQNHVNVPYKS